MHPLVVQWSSLEVTTLLRRRAATAGPEARIGFSDRAGGGMREQRQERFLAGALRLGGRLRAAGIRPGDPLLVATATPEHALRLFVAGLAAGATPMLLPVRPAFDDEARTAALLGHAFAAAGPRSVFVAPQRADGRPLPAPPGARVCTLDLDAVDHADDGDPGHIPSPGDICHLQLTSGSTSAPRAVAVTHANVLANCNGLAKRIELDHEDVIVTWLPLYHDMGLVGQALLSLVTGLDLHVLSPFDFLADPARWLRVVAEKRGTMSATPTFGLDHVVRRVADDKVAGLDLSCWRRVYVGAEPVGRTSLARFWHKLEPTGFDPRALTPTYGLAEATLAVTMPHLGHDRRWIELEGSALALPGTAVDGALRTGLTEPAAGLTAMSVGPALEGVEVWLRGEDGNRIDADGICGEIMVRAASVAAGYLGPDGTPEPFPGGVLATGDVGFLRDHDLYVVERLKNIIIRNGENHSAQLLEEILAEVTAIPVDRVAVIDSDLRPGEGRVTAVVELERRAVPVELEAQVWSALDRFPLALEELVVVRPGALPRTTSGKKRHAEIRAMLAEARLKIVDRFALGAAAAVDDLGSEAGEPVVDLDVVDAVHRTEKVLARIAVQRGIDVALVPEHRLVQDLHFDSLALFEAAMTIEAECGVEIAEDDLAALRSVGDVTGLVIRRIEERRRPGGAGADRRGLTQTVLDIQTSMPQVFREVKAQEGRRVLIDGRWVVDFASCNYLGLDLHPEVIAAVPEMIAEFGVHPSWTRAVASPAPYGLLEQLLADTVGTADTVVFPTVTLTHLGLLPPMAGPSGTIFLDQAAHHSIQEACDLARARGTTVRSFPHGDLDALGRLLAADRGRRRVIAVDGVYSMSGTTVDLAGLQDLARRHDAVVYVDDAHGFGVLGERPGPSLPYGCNGNGVVRHLGLDYERTVYVAGLSKAYSSMAAFVSVNSVEERRMAETASTMIFGGPVPVASLASAIAGLRVNEREGDLLRMRLWRLTRQLLDGIAELGFHLDNATGFPIVNVILGPVDIVRTAAEILWAHGILLTPAVFPATPLDRGGVRFTVTAANTEDEIGQLLDGLKAVREAVGVGRLPVR